MPRTFEDSVACLVLALLAFGMLSLLVVSYPPRKRKSVNVQAQRGAALVLPPICVITGEAATEWHPVRGYLCFFNFFWYWEAALPFSAEGFASYKRAMPASMLIYKGVYYVASRIPLLGVIIAFLWFFWGTPLCGLLAIVDLFQGKRQLVILHKVKIRNGALSAIHIQGVSNDFADRLLGNTAGGEREAGRS